MKFDVTIEDCMTPGAFTVGQEQSLAFASAIMSRHGIRHLPVLHQGR